MSELARHTPGPWFVDPDQRPDMEHNNHVVCKNGDRICFMAHGGQGREQEFNANVHLIAASPELLAALTSLMNEVGGAYRLAEHAIRAELGNTNYQCVIDKLEQARVVVAKAEGRAP